MRRRRRLRRPWRGCRLGCWPSAPASGPSSVRPKGPPRARRSGSARVTARGSERARAIGDGLGDGRTGVAAAWSWAGVRATTRAKPASPTTRPARSASVARTRVDIAGSVPVPPNRSGPGRSTLGSAVDGCLRHARASSHLRAPHGGRRRARGRRPADLHAARRRGAGKLARAGRLGGSGRPPDPRAARDAWRRRPRRQRSIASRRGSSWRHSGSTCR